MTPGLSLLIASVRVAPGLLTRDAWRALDGADLVLARSLDEPLAEAVAASEITVAIPSAGPEHLAALARELLAAAGTGAVVWLSSADGDPGLTDAIAVEVSAVPAPPTVEVIVGSWDAPGARLLDVVAVLDRLRSPGGCPWDAKQTHESLVPYLQEETAEAVEAIESGDRDHIVEELGDVLFQVAFHARVGQEHPNAPFDIDDIAAGLVAKLVRRHPHVFADAEASTPEEVEAQWAAIKAQEKADRDAERAG